MAMTCDVPEDTKKEEMMEFDEILPIIGEFGMYQKTLDIMLCLMNLPVAYQALITYFATMTPDWKCRSNATRCPWNGTLSGDDLRRCDIPRREWKYTEGAHFSLVTTFDVDCAETWLLYLVSCMFFIGWGCGAVVLGYVGDNFGRKRILFPSFFMLLSIGFASSFASNIYLIVVSRFFVGFFTTGTTTQAFILMSELVGTKRRPLAGLIVYVTTPIGWCLLALKAYYIRNWKMLSVVCTVPYMIFVPCFYRYVPESVRWLQCRGKEEQIKNIIAKIASCNKRSIPTGLTVSSTKEQREGTSNPLDIFRTKKLALHTSILAFIWCGTTMGFYGLHFAASELSGSSYRDFVLLNLSQIPALVLAIFICDRFGRKVGGTLVPSFIGSLTCFVIAMISFRMKTVRVVVGVIGEFFVNIAFFSSFTWATEIFPTHLRAGGIGVLEVFECLGSSSSPWVAKGLQTYGEWVPFAVMGLPLLVGSLLGTLLPETKGENGTEYDGSEVQWKEGKHDPVHSSNNESYVKE